MIKCVSLMITTQLLDTKFKGIFYMLSIKIPLQINKQDKDRIQLYQKQYSNLLHVYYNRVREGNSKYQDLKLLQLNHVQLLDSHFKNSCMQQARTLLKESDHIIFGGKKNFFDRLKGLITKEQYQQNRLSPIYSIGQSKQRSNRKFQIIDNQTIIFKPTRDEHIKLKIKCNSKSYKRYLQILKQHQQLRDLPITYQLTKDYINISFDQKILQQEYKQYKPIQNRIISIDMNPNYIGWSIIDWKNSQQFNIIDKGVLSIKNINDYDNSLHLASTDNKKKYITNKRQFQTLQCSKFLIEKMIHYKCQLFTIENLDIKRKNIDKGRKLNKLINNNWCRTKLVKNLSKWCSIYNVQLIKIIPSYSSFIGNMIYRYLKLPDMILSSIQISRRGYQFYHQYIAKDKQIQKNIIQPNLTNNVRSNIIQSLEELNMKNIIWKDLIELYYIIKKSKCKYRFPLQINNIESFRHSVLKFENIVM